MYKAVSFPSPNNLDPRNSSLFLFKDAVELGFVSMGMVVLGFQVLMYRWINSKRDRAKLEEGSEALYTEAQLRDMGDKAPDFRYTL